LLIIFCGLAKFRAESGRTRGSGSSGKLSCTTKDGNETELESLDLIWGNDDEDPTMGSNAEMLRINSSSSSGIHFF
jgi:hypothetical protein